MRIWHATGPGWDFGFYEGDREDVIEFVELHAPGFRKAIGRGPEGLRAICPTPVTKDAIAVARADLKEHGTTR